MTPAQRNSEMDKWTVWGISVGTTLADWGAAPGDSIDLVEMLPMRGA